MTDITIYFAPDTCARVSMIALEETEHPYRAELIRFMTGQHRSPEFLAMNPSGRVPTLVVDGRTLTENVAILSWLNDRFPGAGLLPPAADAFDRALHTSDLAFCASNLHPVVTRLRFPTFFAKEPEALPGVLALAEEAMRRVLLPVEQRLGEGRWWYGDRWSVIDAYVNWVWFRISGTAFATADFPNLQRHNDDLLARPAVQRALARHTDAHRTLHEEGLAVPLPQVSGTKA